MEFGRRTVRHRTEMVFPVLFAVIAVLLCTVCRVSAQDLVTEQNIRDAIMGHQTFTQDQLDQMDLNQDSKLDVADLVKLIKTVNPEIPVAGFDLPNSTIGEADGSAAVRVSFSDPFTGTLNYTTAVGDAAPDVGSIQVSDGLTADIPVTFDNDLTITDGLMITVSLESGQGYAVGATVQHLLSINDDDATWFGTLETKGMMIGFDMDIVQDASSYEATLVSDGTRGIPEGTWPVSLTMTADTFSAVIGPIDVLSDDFPLLSPLGTNFTRTLVLEASNSSDTGFVDLDINIFGEMTDTFEPTEDSRSYFGTVIKGTFNLIKEIRTPGGISP